MPLSIISLLSFFLAAQPVFAQDASSSEDLASPTPISRSRVTSSSISTASVSVATPSGPQTVVLDYGSVLVTSIVGGSVVGGPRNDSTAAPSSASASPSSQSTSSGSLVAITGTNGNSNATATAGSRPRPSNTRPCNGHAELCNRKLSNVTMVVAHNSPFVVPHNAASNQVYPVLNQLEDGIRGLQFETHYPNATAGLSLCHTSCDLLDAGTLESYLTTVRGWLDTHPYEVIAIIMGNDNRVPPATYIEPFQNAGMLQYLYTPPKPNATLEDWPTLAQMILLNKRVVVMLDYLANQTEVPWLLDEFSYQWETPFSPTDPAFPCTAQRPSNQDDEVSRNKMYMANHNLNIDVELLGQSILIPAYTLLDEINAVSGNGSLGRNVDNCTAMWGRPPNWLLVDYYNFGNFNGSVFQAAADANGVSYNRNDCCGSAVASAAADTDIHKLAVSVFAAILSGCLLMF
ncbi:PLC-like phosphodiesterase [Paraphaeosphaeria sporulosa]|uniref:PLC-like phosphodiesterase n=1 Tax=Paraphaeosphaeria sporulosa TaxID=1460663 RepID=A0A177CXF1_9PLEO|nr:PLC-like phosphodiesterase [Paraphaeosphaeria sporulosa]OAG12235.1 PLC-like phosphodiesterase [Paraphaeosphaeria sporulosa]